MPRGTSFCTHTIERDEVLEIQNALLVERFTTNPLVINPPSVKYYAGISLKNVDGHKVGTLCVMDIETHHLAKEQMESLKALSRQVTNIIELNLSIKYLQQSVEQIEARNKTLKKIAQVQSHEIRGPLTSIMGVMNLIKEEDNSLHNNLYINHLENAVKKLNEKIRYIVDISNTAHTMNAEIMLKVS